MLHVVHVLLKLYLSSDSDCVEVLWCLLVYSFRYFSHSSWSRSPNTEVERAVVLHPVLSDVIMKPVESFQRCHKFSGYQKGP